MPQKLLYSLSTLAVLGSLGLAGKAVDQTALAKGPSTKTEAVNVPKAANPKLAETDPVQQTLYTLFETQQLASYDSFMAGKITNLIERFVALDNPKAVKENLMELALLTELNTDLAKKATTFASAIEANKQARQVAEPYLSLMKKTQTQLDGFKARAIELAKSIQINDTEIQGIFKAAKAQIPTEKTVQDAMNTYRLALHLAMDTSQKAVMASQHGAGQGEKNAILHVLSEAAVLAKVAERLPAQFEAPLAKASDKDKAPIQTMQTKTRKALDQVRQFIVNIRQEAKQAGFPAEVIQQTVDQAKIPTDLSVLALTKHK